MSFFDFFKIKKNNDNKGVDIFGFASKEAEEGKGLDQAQIQKYQADFMAILSTDDKHKSVNFAAQLMGKGAYENCIEAYEKLCEKYPEQKGTFEGQIGAAYFFLGKYEQAIYYYLKARESDESNADMMDDNIWEACETIYNEQGNKKAVELYKTYCPQGKYIENADKILKK